ncbi:DUF3000 domain-containing protein [Nocardia transvalensis]|nr:DUF3000 domain-containing protein [Nocardia transvalensis]
MRRQRRASDRADRFRSRFTGVTPLDFRDGAAPTPGPDSEPAQFRAAVDAMGTASVHPRIELAPIRPPQRLAPYSYAIGAEVKHPDTNVIPVDSEGDAFGRLILLHDPNGHEAWHGVFRLVAYIQADIDAALAGDPLLPEVAWSWLVDALESRAEPFTALGGTVTSTSSVRYGDIAGPPRAYQLELRASWTVGSTRLGPHVEAFCEVLAYAAGLPPAGITHLRPRPQIADDRF